MPRSAILHPMLDQPVPAVARVLGATLRVALRLLRRLAGVMLLAASASATLWTQPPAQAVPAAATFAPSDGGREAASDEAGAARLALPRSALAVEEGDEWRTWWRSADAPVRWSGSLPAVAGAVHWRRAAPGVEWGELRLAGSGEAWRLRIVLARVDPARVGFALEQRTRAGGTLGAWTVDSAAPAALLAMNAGQFADARPWGWLVADGVERQPPGYGPQSMALVVDSAGAARLVPMDSIAGVRARGGVAQAFQSYPTLLTGDGVVPLPLRAPGRGVDVEHRDARLAVGELRDGRLVIALTRFEALGGVLAELPFGPTAPEMAALMGALGARRAVLLDGGLSAQLLVRDDGTARRWRGLRRVPLGLVVERR